MRNELWTKGLVFGIILLFIGVSVVPSIGSIIEKSNSNSVIDDISINTIHKSESNENPPIPLDDGLVGYWSFNEGSGTIAHDYSGNGNDGTINGGATWVAGISGYALSFDGFNDYLDLKKNELYTIMLIEGLKKD